MRRVNSLNDLAERAAMLAPFEDTAAAAASAASSSPSSSASSSPVMYPSGLNPLASLASASSAVDPLRPQDGGHQRPLSQTGHTREVAMALTADKKRKREAAEHQHHPHRHVALRPSLPANSSPGRPIGRDLHPQPQHMLSTGNGHFVGHAASRAKMSSSNGAAGMSHHVPGSSIPRSTSLPSLAHMPSPAPLSPPPPLHSPAPPPAFFAQISPNSIHLRDFMDNTKHLLTVMCTSARDNDAAGKTGSGAAAALPSDLRLGFGAVVQPVEKASAYWFAEVPSAYEVLRATGLWQRGFLMEVLCQERHLVVDRTLYCGYKRVCQDKFTFYFDSDSETLRQLYAQHVQIAQAQAQAMAPAPASTFPFANAAGGSGIPFRFSPGMSLPAPVPSQPASTAGPRAYTTSPSTPASTSTANGTGTGHHLATSCPASALNRLFTPIPRMASPSTVPLTPDGPRVVTVDRKHDSEHNHASGCCVKEEDDDDDADDDTDDGFYLLRPANTNDESTEEAESFEQPPAKLFLLPEYCYFDPTVLKKRSIRCIPCKMSLSKMGWKQHMLSTLHVEKKAKFNARGQTSQQSSELVYRSARGVLTCLACAVLLPPEDFDKHVVGAQHAKKRREWAMLDQIERWSDILSKKPRYSTATPLSPTLSSSVLTSPTLMPTTTTTVVTAGTATSGVGMDATASLGSSSSTVELHRSAPLPTTASETHQMELEGPELAELFYVECYPMTPVTGYTQWVALHSTRNWDARNFEVLITSRGKQDRLVVEPLSWKTTTTARGFLFNLAVKFERTYGPDPVQLCLVIRDTMGANPQGHEQEIQIPLGRAIVCSNSSQRLKRLQQLGEESLLTETEQRVIPHYTQCALVHKGREHRYRVKPLATVLAAAASATTSPTLATATTQAPSPSTPAGQPPSGAQQPQPQPQPQPQQQQRTQTPSAATPRPLPFVSGATASLLPSSSMNRSSLPTAALKALLSSSSGTPSHSAPLSTSMMTSLSSSSPAASPSTTTPAVPPVPSPTMTTASTGVPPTTTTTPLGAAAASMQPALHQRRPAAHPSMSSSPSSSSSSALASSSPAARQPLIVKTSS